MDTLYKAKNILDFCKTQNIGKQFHVEETIVEMVTLFIRFLNEIVDFMFLIMVLL